MFGFLSLGAEARERDLERGLWTTCVSSSWNSVWGSRSSAASTTSMWAGRTTTSTCSYYHLRLRCFVVIDLKMGEFEPEFAGKMNFYLSAVDDLLRHEDDGSSLGIILCTNRDRVTVEALRGLGQPIGVSTY